VVNCAGVHRKGTLSLHDVLKSVRDKTGFNKAGALAIFVGVVRGETREGERVKRLELDAYEDKANEVLENICNDLQKREDIMKRAQQNLFGLVNAKLKHLDKISPTQSPSTRYVCCKICSFCASLFLEHALQQFGASQAFIRKRCVLCMCA
jgi:hypothetical protein